MENFLLKNTIRAYRGASRLFGSTSFGADRFEVRTPDEKMNAMMKLFSGELENRLTPPFGLKFRSRWLRSSNHAESYAPESSTAAEVIAMYDRRLAAEVLSPFLENQSLEGNIPATVGPLISARYPAGPFIFGALWKLHMMRPLRKPGELADRMSRFADWLVMHKKKVEGLYAHSDAAWFRNDPCLAELRRAHPERRKNWGDVRSLAYNCLVAVQMKVMAKLATSFGNEKLATRFVEIGGILSERIHDVMWDQNSGFYYDLVGETVARDISIAGFLPLAAEIPTKKQAERVVEWLPFIADRTELVRKTPAMAPMFRLVVQGLGKYGFNSMASDTAVSFIDFAARLDDRDSFFMPRAVAAALLIDEVLGFHRYKDRYVLSPRLPDRWAGMPLWVYDGANDYRIGMTMGEGGEVDCRIFKQSSMIYRTAVQNNTFRNVKFTSIGMENQ